MLRAGVQHLIRQAVQVELDELLLQHANRVTKESTQSWREVLLKLKQRGMNPPQLAIGDGALGFWVALEEVCPKTRSLRCWVHKSVQPKGKTGTA